MFRHRGKSRTFTHNLKLAVLLSFVAGIVNVTGYFSVHTLTTNGTGHFAYFASEALRSEYAASLVFLAFIFSFFLGAFLSSIAVELISRRSSRYAYLVPVAVEIFILTAVSFLGGKASKHSPSKKLPAMR